jgi:hypothetical protein
MVVLDGRGGDMVEVVVTKRKRKVGKASCEKRAQKVFAGSPQSAPKT